MPFEILGISLTDMNNIRKETIASIVREAKILHVAFVDDDGMPQCVPMLGALVDDVAGDHVLYLHGRCSH